MNGRPVCLTSFMRLTRCDRLSRILPCGCPQIEEAGAGAAAQHSSASAAGSADGEGTPEANEIISAFTDAMQSMVSELERIPGGLLPATVVLPWRLLKLEERASVDAISLMLAGVAMRLCITTYAAVVDKDWGRLQRKGSWRVAK